MSFRLKLDEDVTDGLKRVAAQQAGDAIGQLESGEDPHEAVHETRKCCKKIRAVLRLGRDALIQSMLDGPSAWARLYGTTAPAGHRFVAIE